MPNLRVRVKVVMQGRKYKNYVAAKALRGLKEAMAIAEKEAKHLVGRTQPTRRTRSGRLVGLSPSLPGEPPKIVTKTLQENIKGAAIKRGDRLQGYLGVTGKSEAYVRRLERGFFGTDRMGRVYRDKPRPFMAPALKNKRSEMQRALQGQFQLVRGSDL